MRLNRLCWERRGFYLAETDVGVFRVPNEPGGWRRRMPWPYKISFTCYPVAPGALSNLFAFLGIKTEVPTARLGCCYGRR